ncbi:MAG: cupin domain-containing protein [Solirubrobacteraceae bacterium]
MTCVCWSISSETSTRYGSLVCRHGRSRASRAYHFRRRPTTRGSLPAVIREADRESSARAAKTRIAADDGARAPPDTGSTAVPTDTGARIPHGVRRSEHHQPRQRRALHVPAHRRRHRRRAARVPARAHAHGAVPGAHVHPEQTETFHVVEGTMAFRLGLRRVVAGPGETVTVPTGKVHRFSTAGDETAVVRVEVRPALDMERLFETTVALAREGRTLRSGMPKPLHLALFVRRFAHEVRAPFPPPAVVGLLLWPLAALARRRGHGERYEIAALA